MFTSVAVSAPASLFAGIKQRVVIRVVQSPKYLFPREEFTTNKEQDGNEKDRISECRKMSHYV